MNWLNIMLDAGILASQASISRQIDEVRKQNMEAALVDSALYGRLYDLRNAAFKFKNAAEEILLLEETEPRKNLSAGLRILEAWFSQSGLSPDLFFELSDKEYVANASRLIRVNIKRFSAELSDEDHNEINRLLYAVTHRNRDSMEEEINKFFRGSSVVKALKSETPSIHYDRPSSTPVQRKTCPICGTKANAPDMYCLKCGAKFEIQ